MVWTCEENDLGKDNQIIRSKNNKKKGQWKAKKKTEINKSMENSKK